MPQTLTVERIIGRPAASAAFTANVSPRARTMPPMPMGASSSGMASDSPNSSVERSMSATGLSTRWRSAIRCSASMLPRSVVSWPEPPSMYSNSTCGSRRRASSR